MKAVNEPTRFMLMNLQEHLRRDHAAGKHSPIKTVIDLMGTFGDRLPPDKRDELQTGAVGAWVEHTLQSAITDALDELKALVHALREAFKRVGQKPPETAVRFWETMSITWYTVIDIGYIAEQLAEEFITNASSPIAPNMALGSDDASNLGEAASDPRVTTAAFAAQLMRKIVDPSAN
jgi:hypothetical protein